MIPTIEQEPERVPRGLVRRSALIVVITIALCVLATLLLGRSGMGGAGPITSRPPANLDEDVFWAPVEGERMLRESAARLGSYGWVDRQRGIVHVPIDVAIDLYVAERAR